MINYRKAGKGDVGKIAKLCTESFRQYPLYRLMAVKFKDETGYEQFLYDLQILITKTMICHQTVLVGELEEEIVSVAMLESPDRKVGIPEYLMCGGLRLLKQGRIPAVISYLSFLDETMTACNDLHKPMWFLFTLAVDKNCQGMNLGSGMIQEGIIPHITSRQGILLTLTTNTEINSRFYGNNEFVEFDRRTLKWQGQQVENWSFLMSL